METTATVWKLVVFSGILSAVLYGNNVCPKVSTGTLPVVHMCTDESITEVESLFIDAFASASTATTCNCTLHASSFVQITVSAIVAPDHPCDSQININTEHVLTFVCGYGKEASSRNFGPGDISIQLKTIVPTNTDATYCINIAKSFGTGTLSLECFSPTSTPTTRTMTESTSVSTKPPSVSSTSDSTTYRTSSKISSATSTSATSSPDSSQNRTSTSVISTNPEKQQGSDSTPFPVAAAAGGAGGVVLIIIVVIIVVVFIKRKRRNKNYEDKADDNDGYDTVGDTSNEVPLTDNPAYSCYQETQNKRNMFDYTSDPYSSVDDEPSSGAVRAETPKPKVAMQPNIPSAEHKPMVIVNMNAFCNDSQANSQLDDISNMYAKVNKPKPAKTAKTEDKDNESEPQSNDVYAVVDKSKKKTTKAEETGDVYAVVQKKKKSSPKPPPGTPGIIYSDLAFDEDEEEIEGAVGGEDKSDVISTKEDSVTYSSVL